MFHVSDLSPDLPFGSLVRGLQFEHLADDAARRRLVDLWFDRGLVIFRDGEASVEFQIRLSEVFGPLVRHFQEDRLIAGHPELTSFSTDPDRDMVIEVDGETIVGVIPWHGDARWVAQPNHGGILRVPVMPRAGGDTGFIDLISTYDRLPQDLKDRIEGREAIIRFDAKADEIWRYQPRQVRMISPGSTAISLAKRADFPPFIQPLVYPQAATGRKVLGFTPLPLQEVIGLTREESDALLAELARHTTDERHAYFHKWQEDDLVLWDNLRMLHKACGVPPGEQRESWRTTIAAPDQMIARPLGEGGFAYQTMSTAGQPPAAVN